MNLSGKIHKAFNDITDKMKFHIPFTGSYNVWKRLRGSKSILDVGCGTGVAMLSLNRDHCFNYTIGVDGHYPYLKSCRLNNTHTDFVLADIRHLPLIPRSFDSVICLEVLEHLEKKDGYEFLQSLERIAKQGVILALPIGHYGQHAFDGNPYQEHRSQWEPQEMRRLGYNKVTVSSIRGIGGEWRGRGGAWQLLDILYRLFSVAIIPLVTIMPHQ